MPEKARQALLLVDDDENNIDILCLDLEDCDYELLTAKDGVEGWRLLQDNKDRIKAILLDRMMPNMDGMEFTRKLKADESVARIPIVMQTAAAEKEQVVEGISAGVYYYLTKPYEAGIMRSVVKAAAQDFERYAALRDEVAELKKNGRLMREGHFGVRTLSDAHQLSTFLANLFPDSERVVTGILEILLNAVEHGNLGITYEDKGRLLREGRWEAEVTRRQALPTNKDKTVDVRFERSSDRIELTVQDQGEGFDWERFLDFDPARASDSHGRGIALARLLSFDSLQYLGTGSRVTGSVKI